MKKILFTLVFLSSLTTWANDDEGDTSSYTGSSINEKEVYGLAADVLMNMKDKKPEELQPLLEQAKQDPAAFSKTWTPEQQRKLEKLSERNPAEQSK